jgi:hypothetical protein
VRNDSDSPVYDLIVTWRKGSAPWGEFEKRASLAQGTTWASTRALPTDLPVYMDPEVYGVVVWFRDASESGDGVGPMARSMKFQAGTRGPELTGACVTVSRRFRACPDKIANCGR